MNVIENFAERIEELRKEYDALDLADEGMTPEAEQHFRQALDFLSAARRSVMLAHYAQMKDR